MLNYFEERKEIFLTIKNKTSQSPKNRIFSKGLIQALDQKIPNSCLFKFDQNMPRNNAF